MSVAFQAIGATQNTTNFGSSISAGLTLLPTGPNPALVVGLDANSNGDAATSQTVTATCDGIPMTLLGNVFSANTVIALYGALAPSAGVVAVNVGSVASVGRALIMNAVAYTGVAGFGLPATANGANSPPTVVGSGKPGDLIVNLLGGSFLGTQAAYTATQHVNAVTSDNYANLLLGDAAAVASGVTFSCTVTGSGNWGAVAAELLGIPVKNRNMNQAIQSALR